MHQLDHTHDPAAQSWVADAAGHRVFPLQNLPIAVFRRAGSDESWRGGIAIGDQVLDLTAATRATQPGGDEARVLHLASQETLNALMAAGPSAWRALRHHVFALLSASASEPTRAALRSCLVAQAEIEHRVPAQIANYTDFYTSFHHARNVGLLVRPDNPLSPNFQWLPIAYHGRASSVVVSGTAFHRPMGQSLPAGANAPVYGPCARLDYELELGFYIGPGNALGSPVLLSDAEERIFGMCLLNDWSARDQQFWEMTPLGPFLGKNFCTSVSPWIVTMEALRPFRVPLAERTASEPQPLPYLDDAANRAHGGVDVHLGVSLESRQHRERSLPPSPVSQTSFRHQYWSIAQMVTQHTVGGCNLQPGDLLGTGTISGPTPAEAGALIELSRGGTQPITLAHTGEQRAFLADGDAVILSGWCERPGAARIGFGDCRGEVLPASRAN